MILDGEQDEALRVLLEKRLLSLQRDIVLLLLLSLGRLWLLGGLGVVGIDLGLKGGEVGVEGLVLLIRRVEVELLDGGLHLEGLNCSCSLVEN